MVAGLIISIHAPRAGGDDLRVRSGHRMGISIHAHHAGGDLQILRPKGLDDRISIHAPMRGATPIFDKSIKQLAFQSTPPCGGRHTICKLKTIARYFNPRPRAGGDINCYYLPPYAVEFQSTPPCGGRPQQPLHRPPAPAFQSTPPCGGRLQPQHPPGFVAQFQSTPPCGGRLTREIKCDSPKPDFNPRPRAGGDIKEKENEIKKLEFQSTPPCGGRHGPDAASIIRCMISIHAPVRGATFTTFR